MAGETHAFIFTDLVGFTAYTDEHGDEAAADLADAFCARVCELNSGHGAEDVKTLGDGCMIHVPDTGCAVELGLEIVESIGPAHGLPAVRVGMDAGPAVNRRGDWFGMTVNRAARLADIADEASVLLTRAVKELQSNHADAIFLESGFRELRGIAEPAELFRATRPEHR